MFVTLKRSCHTCIFLITGLSRKKTLKNGVFIHLHNGAPSVSVIADVAATGISSFINADNCYILFIVHGQMLQKIDLLCSYGTSTPHMCEAFVSYRHLLNKLAVC